MGEFYSMWIRSQKSCLPTKKGWWRLEIVCITPARSLTVEGWGQYLKKRESQNQNCSDGRGRGMCLGRKEGAGGKDTTESGDNWSLRTDGKWWAPGRKHHCSPLGQVLRRWELVEKAEMGPRPPTVQERIWGPTWGGRSQPPHCHLRCRALALHLVTLEGAGRAGADKTVWVKVTKSRWSGWLAGDWRLAAGLSFICSCQVGRCALFTFSLGNLELLSTDHSHGFRCWPGTRGNLTRGCGCT